MADDPAYQFSFHQPGIVAGQAGDIVALPEPGGMTLAMAGLVLLVVARRPSRERGLRQARPRRAAGVSRLTVRGEPQQPRSARQLTLGRSSVRRSVRC
ncbi:MAG: hypothetical protein U0836_23640 [Pirellulales bacterium]